MYQSITRSQLFVLDQDEALDFYVNKLGLEVSADVDLGFMRWLTVRVPGDPGREILLERPGPPAMDEATAAQVRELVTKGAMGGWLCITTPDAQGTYETLKAPRRRDHRRAVTQALRHRLRHPRSVRQRHPHRPDVRRAARLTNCRPRPRPARPRPRRRHERGLFAQPDPCHTDGDDGHGVQREGRPADLQLGHRRGPRDEAQR